MKISVRYFAALREAFDREREELDTSARTLGELRAVLRERGGVWNERLAADRPVRMALDHVLADEHRALHEHAEVAFFPPVTGG